MTFHQQGNGSWEGDGFHPNNIFSNQKGVATTQSFATTRHDFGTSPRHQSMFSQQETWFPTDWSRLPTGQSWLPMGMARCFSQRGWGDFALTEVEKIQGSHNAADAYLRCWVLSIFYVWLLTYCLFWLVLFGFLCLSKHQGLILCDSDLVAQKSLGAFMPKANVVQAFKDCGDCTK